MFNSTNNPLIFNWTPQNVWVIPQHVPSVSHDGLLLWLYEHLFWHIDTRHRNTVLKMFQVLQHKVLMLRSGLCCLPDRSHLLHSSGGERCPFYDWQVRRTWRQLTWNWRIIYDTMMLVGPWRLTKEQSHTIQASYQMHHQAANVYPGRADNVNNEERQDAESSVGNAQVHPHCTETTSLVALCFC